MAGPLEMIGRNGHEAGPAPRYVLGRYQEFTPGPELADFVQCAWRYSPAPDGPALSGNTHLVLPDPGVDLAFWCRRDAYGVCAEPTLVFMGSVHEPREFQPDGALEIVAVKFHPDAVLPLLGIRPGEQANAIVEFAELNALMAGDLLVQLTETTSWPHALTILLQATRRRLESRAQSRDPMHDYAAAVRAAPTTKPIQWAAEHLSVSARQLRRVFDREFGISPKRFTRILRLLRIMRAADSVARPHWAQLAYRFGYTDQAHLINETRALVGETPATLHRGRRAQVALTP